MSIIGKIKLTTNEKIDTSVNSEGSNYNVHMQSSAYYSQLETALVHEMVYDFYCKVLGFTSSLYLSTGVVGLTTGATI